MDMQNLYLAESVRSLDHVIINEFSVPGYTLMERAGEAAFEVLRTAWPRAKKLMVVCGRGNNAGDGYIVARLAHKFGYDVNVLGLVSFSKLHGDALKAAREAADAGVPLVNGEDAFDAQLLSDCDVIVDAIFGTGLDRAVEGRWFDAIEAINQSTCPVLALDIPSGLQADMGSALGIAIEAQHTVTFIARKQGLYTGLGRQCSGQVHFSDLGAPLAAYEQADVASHLIRYASIADKVLQPRSVYTHKGCYGHVVLVGGDSGMSGAVRLAAEAALRSGAGLVSLATRKTHADLLSIARPELMSHGVESIEALKSLLSKATVLAIGPGLGQGPWARAMFSVLLEAKQAMVVDADALNLLASEGHYKENWVLTPHPGEAARLLATSTQDIERDRFHAAREIQRRYGGVVVLKGAGSVICYAQEQLIEVCDEG